VLERFLGGLGRVHMRNSDIEDRKNLQKGRTRPLEQTIR
jgi:hypothetical protein